MINTFIRSALENRFLTGLIFLLLTGAGLLALWKTPVDAIPDLSENQVIVMTQWSGQTPRNIEDQITYPLTVGMQGLPDVKTVRSSSMLGVSMVTVIFEDSTDIYFARDRVAERLSVLRNQLPMGVMPMLGPDATGVGHIFMYTLESDTHSLTELRSLQDFIVRYELQSISGVAEVASMGGYLKSYQIVLDPLKLDQYGLKISQVIGMIKMANNNVSGNVLEYGEREIAIQGIGFFESPEEIEHVVLGKRDGGTPLTLSDVGTVRLSGKFRRGILADSEEEKVGGIIVMRYGENPLQVINQVKEKIVPLEKTLPDGVTIKPFYDRTDLIKNSIRTFRNVLIQMLIITAGVLWFFLMHRRATIITALALTSGVLTTFLLMWIFKIPSNIMSLGGIAIAIGTMVDSAIVVTENAYQRLLQAGHRGRQAFADRFKIVLASTQEVGAPIVFAIIIICFSFVPIFALEGMEGKLFHPLAFTNIFAMAGALLASLLFVPLGCLYFLKGDLREDKHIPIVRRLQNIYEPILRKALANRKIVFSIVGTLLVATGIVGSFIGSEFMPPLNEGAIMYMPMTVPDVSERKAQELLIETNKIFSEFPEVAQVVGKAGRSDTATDPAPLAMIETFITLKPKSEWRKGMTKDKLMAEMNRKVNFPNLWNGFTQPIIGRIDMVSTGIRSEVGIKIFGDDDEKLEELALEVENLMLSVPGATGVVALRTSGLKYLNIDLDEEKLAMYGIAKSDALDLVEIGTGGKVIGRTIEGREKYDIDVRFQRTFREDIPEIKALPLRGKNGQRVPLSSVADISIINGPAVLHSENAKLRGAVQMNVTGRDLGSFIKEARKHLDTNLILPAGYSVEFDGQYKNQIRAKKKLSWVVPTVVVLIFLILFLTYKDMGLVSIVMLAIPLSLIGGIIALFLAQFNFSVAVWVGFIALFGNAVETGVVIVLYLENTLKEKLKSGVRLTHNVLQSAVIEGATKRLRPVMMTAFTSVLGLLPMLLSRGVGAELQKPLAVVVVGGLITSIVMTLVVIPLFFAMLREKTHIYSLQKKS
jgi:copper/silver efflux system protein